MSTSGLLARSLVNCTRKPGALLCASGMGYYPSSGEAVLTEDCPAGMNFLAGFQQAGEATTAPASQAGIRVVHLRIPMVIGEAALQRIGFYGGNGQQWASWIGRDELASISEFTLNNEALTGPVDAASPNPLRYADFAAVASKALEQKPGGGMPACLVRLTMGEISKEFVLSSRRMQPAKLLATG